MRGRALLLLPATLLLLAADTPPGNSIRVKGVTGDTVLTLVPSDGGGLVRADVLARLLGGSLDSTGSGQWRLGLYGVSLDLRAGSPFAGYNGFTLPLAEPTRAIDGALFVPLQLFSEIVPRFGIGIIWDRSRSEVRLFQAIARRAVPTLPAGTPAPTIPATVPSTAAGGTRVANTATATAPAVAKSAPRRDGSAPTGLSRRYTVVVDAGHGGRDPGMQGAVIGGSRVSEARVTLAVAKRLERVLEAMGYDVVMTRRTDTLIARDERGPIANRAKGDLFISVHVNSANPAWRNPTAARGFETFYLSTARTEDERHVAAMENDVVRFESESERPRDGDPLGFIINDMARNEHLRESSDLATVVQRHLGTIHPGPDRGVKQGGLAVLATAYMPAVLVEIGFGSNPAEARWMMSEQGQEDTARAIAAAAAEYAQHYDRRARASQR